MLAYEIMSTPEFKWKKKKSKRKILEDRQGCNLLLGEIGKHGESHVLAFQLGLKMEAREGWVASHGWQGSMLGTARSVAVLAGHLWFQGRLGSSCTSRRSTMAVWVFCSSSCDNLGEGNRTDRRHGLPKGPWRVYTMLVVFEILMRQ